jgi:hypothetical protein
LAQGTLKWEKNFGKEVPTSYRTNCISIIKSSWLMLFSEIVAVYSQNHLKHINTFYGLNAVFKC